LFVALTLGVGDGLVDGPLLVALPLDAVAGLVEEPLVVTLPLAIWVGSVEEPLLVALALNTGPVVPAELLLLHKIISAKCALYPEMPWPFNILSAVMGCFRNCIGIRSGLVITVY
jgi:hypothetical protein